MFEMPWQYELTGRQLESLCANIGTLPSVLTAQYQSVLTAQYQLYPEYQL